LFPGLHPDGFEAAASGWPSGLQHFVGEALRRSLAADYGGALQEK
jgi:hypothetical protein